MIEFSKHESEIFNVPFGRLLLEEDFSDWTTLKQQIADSECKYIRVKLKNPRADELDNLFTLAPKVHLLEIMRVYRSADLLTTQLPDEPQDICVEIVEQSSKEKLAQFVADTYDDITFGNYTPTHLLKQFPEATQLQNLIEYFRDNYCGNNPNKVAHFYYNQENKLIACSIVDFLNQHQPNSAAYLYYISTARDERNKGIQFKTVNKLMHIIKNQDYHYFECATRLTNLFSARTMEKSGCKCYRYDWVYLLEK